MSVSGVLSLVTFKKLISSRCDDWIDKLNHAYTVSLLLIFSGIVTTAQIAGDPIHCWTPAEFNSAYESYTKSYCWIKNSYYIPMIDTVPENIEIRQSAEITYYQWIPMILLFMALAFKFPNILWKILSTHTGLNLTRIGTIADTCICSSPEERKNVIRNLAYFMDMWLKAHRQYQHNFLVRAKAKVAKVVCIACSKRGGKYMSAVYLSVKMLYVFNVIAQFYLLNIFLGMNFNSFGYEVLDRLSVTENLRASPRFPRVTLCDFQIRQLQNVQRFTIQCVLPINLFNEKVFIFLWFWLFLVAVLSTVNCAKWLFWLIIKKNNYEFVKKYLKISCKLKTETDKKLCAKFAERYMRDDGCFVLRMIAMNSTDLVVIDLLDVLWKKFKRDRPVNVSRDTGFAEDRDEDEMESLSRQS